MSSGSPFAQGFCPGERCSRNLPAFGKLVERIGVARPEGKISERTHARDFRVALHRNERHRLIEERKPRTQVFADLSLHGGSCGPDFIDAAEFRNPLGRRLRTAPLDPGDVVDLVAHQRKVVDHAFGRHAVLFNHAGAVIELRVHRIENHDIIVDELRKILVAGSDNRLDALALRHSGERPDDVVGLDSGDNEHLPAERRHYFFKGLDLHAEIVGHGRAIGLVLGIHLMTEGLSRRIENDRRHIGLRERMNAREHSEEALDRSGGLARRRREGRKGVVGAEKII